MTDLITTLGLAGGAAWTAQKLLGPALDAAGGDLAGFYKNFRAENIRNIFTKAKPYVEKRSIKEEREPISPKLLYHIIEKASLESDDVVQYFWAKVISSSSSDNESDTLFITNILSQITRREAETFDRFCLMSSFDFKRQLTEDDYGDMQNTYIENLLSLSLPVTGSSEEWQPVLTDKLWRHNFWWPARLQTHSQPERESGGERHA